MRTCGACCRHYVGTFAFLAVFLFLAGYLWSFVLPVGDLRILHDKLLQIAILGYTGHNTASLLLGILEAATWGAVIGGIYSIFEQSYACKSCDVNIIVEEE